VEPWLTYDTFAPLVGDAFDATSDGIRAELTLVDAAQSATPGGTGPNGETRNQFALEFRGPLATPLAQSTYSLSHPALGTVTIFLVPIRENADGRYYEAAFA
jgi:hypothetical protein